MMPLSDPSAAAFAVDAARAALRDAEERLGTALAQAAAVDDRAGWVSPAGAAFRDALADWSAELLRQRQHTAALEGELLSTRAALLVGAGAGGAGVGGAG
jgi:hypothetical protein